MNELQVVAWMYISEDPLDGGEEVACTFEPDRRKKWPLVRLSEATARIAEARREALEEAAKQADKFSVTGHFLLMAGECSAQELRTGKAISAAIARAIRRRGT